jgi:hypothetical protein
VNPEVNPVPIPIPLAIPLRSFAARAADACSLGAYARANGAPSAAIDVPGRRAFRERRDGEVSS